MGKSDQRYGDLAERVARLETKCEPTHWVKWLVGFVSAAVLVWMGWVGNRVVQLGVDAAAQKEAVAGLRKDVDHLTGKIDRLAMQESVRNLSAQSPTKQTLAEGLAALRKAREEKVQIDPPVLKAAAENLTNVVSVEGELTDDAWAAFMELVQYRSALNGWRQPWAGVPGPCLTFPSNQERIAAEVDHNILVGCPLALDGVYWHDNLFVDSVITYRGGPVRIKDVQFLNCTFKIERTRRAIQFGLAVVRNSTVSVDLSG